MIVYGKNVVKEVISTKKEIKRVILSNNFDNKEILDGLKGIKIEYMNKRDMDYKYSSNNQGIVMEIEDYKYSDIKEVYDKNFIVILDHLEDPHNFGAIIRTCEAAGVDAIIIPKKRSVEINSTVMKVSAGALNNIKIVEVNNLVNAMEKLQDNGFWIYGTDMENSEVYTDVKYDAKTALVIGAEGNGIGRLVREKCDFVVNIPMTGKINSLNASVAAAIVIYEVVRQRRIK